MAMILLFAQIATQGGKLQGGARIEAAGTGAMTSIDITPQALIAGLGQSINYSAYANFAAPTAAVELFWEDHPEAVAAGVNVTSQCTWTSSNPAVATIASKSDPQVVTTVGVGQTNITCTIGTVSGFGQLTVAGVVVSPAAVPSATINVPYSVSFGATGGTAPYTFSLTNGGPGLSALGLVLSGATLSGTPIATGTYSFDVQATDSSTPAHTGLRQYQLTVQPPAGTNVRQAHLPQLWADPSMANFPSPCNAANNCDTKHIHTDGLGDYACSSAGVNQAISDWVATPVQQYREIVVDDALSAAGQCRMTVGTTPLTFLPKLGVIGWLWIHSEHPTPPGHNACGGWSAIDTSVDQTARDCPANGAFGKNHMWYLRSSSTLQMGNGGSTVRVGNMDSAGNGPSHYRISNMELDMTGPMSYQFVPVWMMTLNQGWGNFQQVCSQMGMDYNYIHADFDDNGISPTGTGAMAVSTGVMWGCRNSWYNWNTIDRIGARGGESKPFSLTSLPPNGQMMVVGNWFEGGIYSFFIGGACSFLGCDAIPSDIEMRKNYFAQNPQWVVNGDGLGTACNKPNYGRMSMKNLGELKFGVRVLMDGNVFQWSNACGQAGQSLTLNVRSCSAGLTCDAYGTTIEDITVTNNVFRHTGNGIQVDSRSAGSGAGLSVSKPGRRWNFINNLFYDIANMTRHTGANPVYFISNDGAVAGDLRWNRCWATRDSVGVTTMDCSNGALWKITSVAWAPTSTRADGTACTANNCQIVTIGFAGLNPAHPPLTAPLGFGDRVEVSGLEVGVNLNASVRTICSTSTNCAANTATTAQYRCGSTADSEPACPTATQGPMTGDMARIGQRQTDHMPGDVTVVTGCDDKSFNTAGGENTGPTGVPGPPALPGTNGVGPNGGAGGGLIVVYQSISGAPATTENCTFRNAQGWTDGVIISHNTMVGTDTSSPGGSGGANGNFRGNPQVAAGTVSAGSVFPYIQNGQIQDNMSIINPASNAGGTGWFLVAQTEGINSQRAGWELGTLIADHMTFAGRSSQAANYRQFNPTCFAAGNCLAGNSTDPNMTLWFPALGPCSGTTVTTSGSGFVTASSSNCPGFNGMMNGVPWLLDATPLGGTWQDPLTVYALQPYNSVGSGAGNTCTANCGSPYARGGPREASDGTDMGADMNRIRHAQQRTIYDDCSAATGTCGTGPYSETGGGSPSPPPPPTGPLAWTLVGNTGVPSSATALRIISDPNGTLYATANDGGGFARSTDHGTTWSPFNTGSSQPCSWGIGLNDIGEVISGVMHFGAAPCLLPSVPQRLIGNGNTWTEGTWCQQPGGGAPQFLISNAVSGSNTLASGSGIICYSTDHGATWKAIQSSEPGVACGEKLSLAAIPGTSTVAISLATCMPYYSADGGVNWQPIPQGGPPGIPGTADNFNMTLPNGSLFYSWNSNQTNANFIGWCYGPQPPPNGSWTSCHAGLTGNLVNGPGVVTKIGHNAVISTGPCGVFSSVDNGLNWTKQDTGLATPGTGSCPYPQIEGIATDPQGYLYLIEHAGNVWKSTTPQ